MDLLFESKINFHTYILKIVIYCFKTEEPRFVIFLFKNGYSRKDTMCNQYFLRFKREVGRFSFQLAPITPEIAFEYVHISKAISNYKENLL